MLRELVEKYEFEFENHPIRVTISVGVGAISDEVTSVTDLIKLADVNLYKAKDGGRNRVVG